MISGIVLYQTVPEAALPVKVKALVAFPTLFAFRSFSRRGWVPTAKNGTGPMALISATSLNRLPHFH